MRAIRGDEGAEAEAESEYHPDEGRDTVGHGSDPTWVGPAWEEYLENCGQKSFDLKNRVARSQELINENVPNWYNVSNTSI